MYDTVIANMTEDIASQNYIKARKQVVFMLCAVIIVFFLCLIPGRLIVLWMTFATKRDLISLGFEGYLSLNAFSRIMYFLNSAANPIIYNVISTKFRNAFKQALHCQYGRIRQHRRLGTVTSVSSLGFRHSMSKASYRYVANGPQTEIYVVASEKKASISSTDGRKNSEKRP